MGVALDAVGAGGVSPGALVVRRTAATGKWVGFHTDAAGWTAQVPLSADAACVGAVVGMMAKTVTALDDSLSLHGAFSTAVSGRYQDFDAKFDADKEDAVKALTSWNIPAFVKALRERCPALDWASVFEHLDTPALEVPSAAGLGLIVEVHRQALGTALPARCLLGRWTNTHAQLQLLTHLVGSKGHADVDLSKARRVEAAPEAVREGEGVGEGEGGGEPLALGEGEPVARLAEARGERDVERIHRDGCVGGRFRC